MEVKKFGVLMKVLTTKIYISKHLHNKLFELGFVDAYYKNDAYYQFLDKKAYESEGEIQYPMIWICENSPDYRENSDDSKFIFCPNDDEHFCIQCDFEDDLIHAIEDYRKNENRFERVKNAN